MDVERIKDDIMAQLNLTGAMNRARVDFAFARITDNILTFSDWSFLDTKGTVSVTSSQSKYPVMGNFLYPLPELGAYSDDGVIKIRSPEWIHTRYPDVSLIGGVKYCMFTGREVEFFYVGDLTETLEVNYWYHRLGNLTDLDVDPGFVDIIRNGIIKSVSRDINERIEAGRFYLKQLEKKANTWERHFGGDTRFEREERDKNFEVARKNIRW